jgi:hypothetical protein
MRKKHCSKSEWIPSTTASIRPYVSECSEKQQKNSSDWLDSVVIESRKKYKTEKSAVQLTSIPLPGEWIDTNTGGNVQFCVWVELCEEFRMRTIAKLWEGFRRYLVAGLGNCDILFILMQCVYFTTNAEQCRNAKSYEERKALSES